MNAKMEMPTHGEAQKVMTIVKKAFYGAASGGGRAAARAGRRDFQGVGL